MFTWSARQRRPRSFILRPMPARATLPAHTGLHELANITLENASKKLTVGIVAHGLVLALSSAAGIVLMTDPKALGDQMVSRLEALTQRKVTLSTPPSIAWSLSPELDIQDLAVQATDAKSDALAIGQVRARLDLREVIQGILNFDQLEVRDVVVNWTEDARRLVQHLRTLSSASASGTELRLEGASIATSSSNR